MNVIGVLCLLQVLLEVVACTVVFQFVPESSNSDAGGRVPSYYDKLNSWVCSDKLFNVYTIVFYNGLPFLRSNFVPLLFTREIIWDWFRCVCLILSVYCHHIFSLIT